MYNAVDEHIFALNRTRLLVALQHMLERLAAGFRKILCTQNYLLPFAGYAEHFYIGKK
jgi:hypothetical protein